MIVEGAVKSKLGETAPNLRDKNITFETSWEQCLGGRGKEVRALENCLVLAFCLHIVKVYSTQPLHVYFHESRGGNWEEGGGKWERDGRHREYREGRLGREERKGGGWRERKNGRGIGNIEKEEWGGRSEWRDGIEGKV
jgi:hypothetical protein